MIWLRIELLTGIIIVWDAAWSTKTAELRNAVAEQMTRERCSNKTLFTKVGRLLQVTFKSVLSDVCL